MCSASVCVIFYVYEPKKYQQTPYLYLGHPSQCLLVQNHLDPLLQAQFHSLQYRHHLVQNHLVLLLNLPVLLQILHDHHSHHLETNIKNNLFKEVRAIMIVCMFVPPHLTVTDVLASLSLKS